MDEVNFDEKRFVITTGYVGDEMQMTWHADGSLYIEIDEPWQGSTDTGFGARCAVTLAPDAAKLLKKWLTSPRAAP